MFSYYMKRIYSSAVFWGCAVLLAIVMIIGCYWDLSFARKSVQPVLYCFLVTNTVGISHALVPIVAAAPFLYFYVEEIEKKAVYYQMIRSSKKAYFGGQIAAALLSASSVIIVTLVLFTVICLAFGANWGVNPPLASYFRGAFFEDLMNRNGFILYLIYAGAMVLYCLPWTLFGMLTSFFTRNKYMIIAMPYISFMILSYLTELLPVMWLNPGMTLLKAQMVRETYGGVPFALVYNMSLAGVLALIYYIASQRRIRHEGL